MRIINIGPSFAGFVVVNNEHIYINVADGTGFHKIFDIMKGNIQKLAMQSFYLYGYKNFEDAHQDVCVAILEGVLKYQPDKNTSLSTFLHLFVKNRMIDFARVKKNNLKLEEIIDENGFFKDPIDKIDLMYYAEEWDEKWKTIMFRLFVNEEKLNVVAFDISMTPWGLTRAVRRKLQEARKK